MTIAEQTIRQVSLCIVLINRVKHLHFSINERVKYGWDKPERNEDSVVIDDKVKLKYPDDGWSPLVDFFSTDSCPEFNTSNIVTYFVTRTVKDLLPAGAT